MGRVVEFRQHDPSGRMTTLTAAGDQASYGLDHVKPAKVEWSSPVPDTPTDEPLDQVYFVVLEDLMQRSDAIGSTSASTSNNQSESSTGTAVFAQQLHVPTTGRSRLVRVHASAAKIHDALSRGDVNALIDVQYYNSVSACGLMMCARTPAFTYLL